MKNFIMLCLLLVMGIAAYAAPAGNIDEKLMRSFQAAYPQAREVSWYELPETYVVYFVEAGIRTRIYYSKDGLSAQFVRYYQEQHLPLFIRHNIKMRYPDKKVYGVTEISVSSAAGKYAQVVYTIKMEDARNWFTVRMDNEGNAQVVEKFRKL